MTATRIMQATRRPIAFATILTLVVADDAYANSCISDDPSVCQPVVTATDANPFFAGVDIQWQFNYDLPPNTIQVYRQLAGTAGPTPGPTPIYSCTACGFGRTVDKTITPGVLYRYWVCAVWDNFDTPQCAPYREAGLIGPPPPSPNPTYPSNLKINESLVWATPTHAERRWTWSWDAGNHRDYAFVLRERYVSSPPVGWSAEGNSLKPDASGFEEVLGIRSRPSGSYRVCGANHHPGGGPDDPKGCSNAVTFTAQPVPLPKAPVRFGAAATSRTKIDVWFSSGDDNVSAWFDVQRLNGPGDSWLTITPRVLAGSPGQVVDDGKNAVPGYDRPFTYRVCAGNESGKACTDPFKARIADVQIVEQFRLVGLAGKCLTAETGANSAINGTRVVLYACMNGFDGKPLQSQLWYDSRTSAHQLIGPDGKCLEVTGGNPTSGIPIELWECNQGPHQSWIFTAEGGVRGLAGKCLDVSGGNPDDGTPLTLWDCTGGQNQKWTIAYIR